MKSSDFADLLINFSEVSTSVGALDVAADWVRLAEVFTLQSSKKSGDVCKLIANAGVPTAADRSVPNLLSNLDSLMRLLKSVSKKEPTASLGELQDALVAVKACRLLDVVDAVKLALTSAKPNASRKTSHSSANLETIQQLFDQLEASLGNEREFKSAHAQAQSSNLTVADLKALAKKFTGSTAKSKDHALKLIWLRHASLLESRAKDAAIGGRTAA
jgi:hypothetical protein